MMMKRCRWDRTTCHKTPVLRTAVEAVAGAEACHCDFQDQILAQARLVQAMLLAGEAGLAMEFATMLQLPASAVHIEPSVLAEQARHRTSTYLQMPLPRTSKLQEILVPHHASEHNSMQPCVYTSLKSCKAACLYRYPPCGDPGTDHPRYRAPIKQHSIGCGLRVGAQV